MELSPEEKRKLRPMRPPCFTCPKLRRCKNPNEMECVAWQKRMAASWDATREAIWAILDRMEEEADK